MLQPTIIVSGVLLFSVLLLFVVELTAISIFQEQVFFVFQLQFCDLVLTIFFIVSTLLPFAVFATKEAVFLVVLVQVSAFLTVDAQALGDEPIPIAPFLVFLVQDVSTPSQAFLFQFVPIQGVLTLAFFAPPALF